MLIQQVPSETASASPGNLTSPVRVVILASRPLTSAALRSAVAESADIKIVGETASLSRLEELLATTPLDALLLDGTDPLWDACEALMRIRCQSGRRVGVVVLSHQENTDIALRYLRVGADALVCDDSALDEIANAVRAVAQGHAVLPPPIARSVLDLMSERLPAMSASRHLPGLTAREQEILQLITTGLSNQEVADTLVLSDKTVKFHVSNLLRKLGVRNRAQAIVYAHGHLLPGIVPGQPPPGRAPALPDRRDAVRPGLGSPMTRPPGRSISVIPVTVNEVVCPNHAQRIPSVPPLSRREPCTRRATGSSRNTPSSIRSPRPISASSARPTG